MKVAIIDYGMGNLCSVQNALNYLGVKSVISKSRTEILSASHVILPGVGSYRKAMQEIRAYELGKVIHEAVDMDKPILGICLGMQLLCESSTEDGQSEGLGLIKGHLKKFDGGASKCPHIGFQTIKVDEKSRLYRPVLNEFEHTYYFVHSYYLDSTNVNSTAIGMNGIKFTGSIEYGNIFGTQFHPEKSHFPGLNLLSNFIKIK